MDRGCMREQGEEVCSSELTGADPRSGLRGLGVIQSLGRGRQKKTTVSSSVAPQDCPARWLTMTRTRSSSEHSSADDDFEMSLVPMPPSFGLGRGRRRG